MVIVSLDVKMEGILLSVVICFSLLCSVVLGGGEFDAVFVFVLVCFPLILLYIFLFHAQRENNLEKPIINRHYNDFEKYAIHSIYHMYRY